MAVSSGNDLGGRSRLVIGIGNPLRGDDGLGFEAAEALRDRVGVGTRVVKCAGESLSLLESWRDADFVILIDAVRSGVPPGTLHRRDLGRDPVALDAFTFSTHALSLAETVALGRVLGRLPTRLLFHGVEAGDFSTGSDLSPAVAEALPALVESVLEDLRELPAADPP